MNQRLPDAGSQNRDWFLKAIETDGSVGQCLDGVAQELEQKMRFIHALRTAIAERNAGGIDAVSEIGQRIKILDTTLKFRLSILSPERKGAWFRESPTTSGPFVSNVLSEAVFPHFDVTKIEQMRTGLSACWERKTLIDLPFRATETCLWKTLLTLNFELETINKFSLSWPGLTELPEKLPVALESRALRAFLLNVKGELLSHRERLMRCFISLREASERFWQFHATEAAQRKDSPRFTGADELRGEFSRRRNSTRQGGERLKTSADLEALRFMGFAEVPKHDELKQRYHSLAREMHPDRPGGNEQKFKLLTKSYRHLHRISSRDAED